MRSDTRPAGARPGDAPSGPASAPWPEAGPAAGAGHEPAGRPASAPAVSGPYALHLVRSAVPVTRTNRPGGRPDRRAVGRLARHPTERVTQRQERTPSGGETRAFQYDAAGRLARVLSNNGLAESYQYDAEGRREREINGRRGHLERRFFYGPDNRLLMTRSGLGCVSYEHDAAGFRSARVEMVGTVRTGPSASPAFATPRTAASWPRACRTAGPWNTPTTPKAAGPRRR
ncbi:MAG: hypothetical protein AB7D57_04785 [Desulfovibrionaceae bacterium]